MAAAGDFTASRTCPAVLPPVPKGSSRGAQTAIETWSWPKHAVPEHDI